ncbi:MAG: tetratricopeptide repeat protein, partial [Planctomycetota bacterium]
AVTYWPVLGCRFIWDDDDYVTQNPVLLTLGGFWSIWLEPHALPQYYPLVHTTFWLEYRLWGDAPLGYHIVNVLLHITSAALLWQLLQKLAIPGALFAALWFTAHPVHVESVAWITERKNVLSLVCYLLAARHWLRWYESGPRRDWWFATAWFLAALLSKTVTASLPAALCVVVWWLHGKVTRRALRGVSMWLLLGGAFAWLTIHLEATHVGAANTPWQLAGGERLLVAGRAVWFYLGSLLWPFGTCFNYPRWQLDTTSMIQWIGFVAAVLVTVLAVALHRRMGRGLGATLLLFGGTLVPALGFFDVFPFRYSFVADHFQYHASIAMLVAMSAAGTTAAARFCKPAVAKVLAASMVALASVVAHRYVHTYRDLDTLWRHTLACNGESTLALANLGAMANERGDSATAKSYLERCLALDPTSYESLVNLGVIAHRDGDFATARRRYEAALRLKPDLANAMNNFAVLYLDEGRPHDALQLVAEALRSDPDYYDAHATCARALHDSKQWEPALDECQWVLARTPEAFETRQLAVTCLLALERHDPAAGNALLLLAQRPDTAAVQQQLAVALAHVLREVPPNEVFAKANNACRNGNVDPAPILPIVERQLRQIHATAQADAIAAGLRGG